ncbi:hypothetical protein [Desulfosporosinus acidiphilus]|nr:hypothetical protein [Desulfosporosinus acidiphilus]
MTAQEKKIVDTILTDVGLESLKLADRCDDHKTKPTISKTTH